MPERAGQLLDDYIRRRDETALAALVHRHGPMVWGVCRRILRNYHDAEDAFQATFLVLVRKGAFITRANQHGCQSRDAQERARTKQELQPSAASAGRSDW